MTDSWVLVGEWQTAQSVMFAISENIAPRCKDMAFSRQFQEKDADVGDPKIPWIFSIVVPGVLDQDWIREFPDVGSYHGHVHVVRHDGVDEQFAASVEYRQCHTVLKIPIVFLMTKENAMMEGQA